MSITITSPSGEPAIGRWQPEVGQGTSQFLDSRKMVIPGPAMDTVLNEAKAILSHCVPPDDHDGSAVVLVVGYVQSGKTLSFTMLASLARDNGYGAVILLAGTTNNLKTQSQDRLEKDLGLDQLQRGWTQIFENPDLNGPAMPKMVSAVKNWRRRQEGKTTEQKPALVVSVLKHAGRINAAAAAFREIDLTRVPVLIIDDESDQATPNTKARRNLQTGSADESAIYASVSALRSALPHHSLVQYTATPQANLLLATADRLNPDYAQVLSSGSNYTGGKVFFLDRLRDLIKVVPDAEIYDTRNPLLEPPEGLQLALRVFLLGVADANIKGIEENRSMMVQAHQNTEPHQVYIGWIRALLVTWQNGLADGGSFREEVIRDFRTAYDELGRTATNLESFDNLLSNLAERAAELSVVEVNSTAQAEKQIKWNSAYYWLLIGGMKLDRGFTVEGLTVTYMPRPISGTADVLQQRARFFGYRGRYIEYCRVFLLDAAKKAFVDYVGDEEFLRASLRDHQGRPPSEWKRDFVLHRQFAAPTRVGIVGRRGIRRRAGRGWIWPKSMHLDKDVREANRRLFLSVLSTSDGSVVEGSSVFEGAVDRRGSRHNLARTDVPLTDALDFLLKVRVAAVEDSLLLSAVTLQLARIVHDTRDGDPRHAVFVFISGLEVPAGRGRRLDGVRSAINVGMNPLGATGSAVVYSGDDTFKSADALTIQLRSIRIADNAPFGEDYSAVPWLSINIPTGLSRDFYLDLD